jgi:hypothetical protein
MRVRVCVCVWTSPVTRRRCAGHKTTSPRTLWTGWSSLHFGALEGCALFFAGSVRYLSSHRVHCTAPLLHAAWVEMAWGCCPTWRGCWLLEVAAPLTTTLCQPCRRGDLRCRYATFSYLAGVSETDDPPVPPLPVDLDNTALDIYGNRSFPPVDGRNLWPMLIDPSAFNISSAHEYLVLTKEVLVAGKWKLLVSQPHFKSQNEGWKNANGTWLPPVGAEIVACQAQDASPSNSTLPVPGQQGAMPCLFDIRADAGEHVDVSATNADVVQQLYTVLKKIVLTQRDCSGWSYAGSGGASIPHSIPGPVQPDGSTSCSPPELLGACDPKCATAKWKTSDTKADGPVCGVPGCDQPVAA